MATYVMSDIHGCYTMFKEMLVKINFDETKDKLIVLGDITDRGLESTLLLDFFIKNRNNPAYVLLKGNHEEHTIDILEFPQGTYPLAENSTGHKIVDNYYGYESYNEYKRFLMNLPEIYEYKNFVLTHAGLSYNWDTNETEVDLWDRKTLTRKYPVGKDKILVCGHTPTILQEDFPLDNRPKQPGMIWHGEGIICVDCGAVFKRKFGGNLGCLNLDTMEEYYI